MQNKWLRIDLNLQKIYLYQDKKNIFESQISSGKNGIGNLKNSGCTPLGWHIVRAKIGDNCHENSVFKARRFTQEIYSESLAEVYPNRDWILGRILWLSGLEIGYNRRGQCDTMQRYIYIHGTSDVNELGNPISHGCIRMSPQSVCALYDLIDVYMPVYLHQ